MGFIESMNERVRRLFLIPVVVALAGCTTFEQLPVPEPTGGDEEAYFEAAMAAPLTFTLPNEDVDMAWGRAQSFIGKHSSMNLQIATDYVLQTYEPSVAAYGYSVTRTPLGDDSELDVRCLYEGFLGEERRDLNAHVLAYYMCTGELDSKFVSQ